MEDFGNRKDVGCLALSDQLDGYLKTVQNWCATIVGYEKGGVICEFEIPEKLLAENETIVSFEPNGETNEFMLFYVPIDQVSSDWVREWILDKQLNMLASEAYEILCEKYKTDPPMDIQKAYDVNFS